MSQTTYKITFPFKCPEKMLEIFFERITCSFRLHRLHELKVPGGGFNRQYEHERVKVTVNKTNQKCRQNLLMLSRGQLCFHASRLHD